MSRNQHTPGPWKVSEYEGTLDPSPTINHWFEVWPAAHGQARSQIAQVIHGNAAENAALIAASPTLLESSWKAIELINKGQSEAAKTVLAIAVHFAEGRVAYPTVAERVCANAVLLRRARRLDDIRNSREAFQL